MRNLGLCVGDVHDISDADWILFDLDSVRKVKIDRIIDKHPEVKIYGVSSCRKKCTKFKKYFDGVFSKKQSTSVILKVIEKREPVSEAQECIDIKLLKYLRQGLSDKAIAYDIDIPLSTVKY